MPNTVNATKAWARKFGRERLGTFRILFVIRLLQWPGRAIARPIIKRLPRDRRLIAFGSASGRFTDNSAYLFLHMAEMSEVRCVWVTESKDTVQHLQRLGYEAAHRWSFTGVRVALRASWYVFTSYPSDINRWLSDGAVALNLWHGVGVKRIQRGRLVGAGSSMYLAPDRSLTAHLFADDRRPPDWLLTTSPMVTRIFSAAFDVAPERCIELGYPRNDHLINGCQPPDALVDRALYDSIAAKGPVVGYFPTFRDSSVTLPGGAPVIAEMSAIISAQGGTLVFKAHHATSVPGVDDAGAVILPKDADLNTYLGLCDVLITDYSSVVNDYLVLNRPVVLFFPDLEEYRDQRGFFFDPAELLPGTLTTTKAELYGVLSHLDDIPVSEHSQRLMEQWWANNATPGACARLQEFISDQLAITTTA